MASGQFNGTFSTTKLSGQMLVFYMPSVGILPTLLHFISHVRHNVNRKRQNVHISPNYVFQWPRPHTILWSILLVRSTNDGRHLTSCLWRKLSQWLAIEISVNQGNEPLELWANTMMLDTVVKCRPKDKSRHSLCFTLTTIYMIEQKQKSELWSKLT